MFLMVGIGVLLGAALLGSSEVVGGLVVAPFVVLALVFKIALLFLLFGFVAKMLGGATEAARSGWGWHGPSHQRWSGEARQHWHGGSESDERKERQSEDDRFDEWHRMAHARREVDDAAPPVED